MEPLRPSRFRTSLKNCSSRRQEAHSSCGARGWPKKLEPPDVGCYGVAGTFRHALRSFGFAVLAAFAFAGCGPKESLQQRADSARALFDGATRNYHIPSANTNDAERVRLQNLAAGSYEQLLKKYPEQEHWAAQALRSLGNIRAAQTNLTEAVKHFAAVENKYPRQRWEILQARKSAADLLWDAGRREEAKPFYRKIVVEYDRPESVQLEKIIVRGAKARLADDEVTGTR